MQTFIFLRQTLILLKYALVQSSNTFISTRSKQEAATRPWRIHNPMQTGPWCPPANVDSERSDVDGTIADFMSRVQLSGGPKPTTSGSTHEMHPFLSMDHVPPPTWWSYDRPGTCWLRTQGTRLHLAVCWCTFRQLRILTFTREYKNKPTTHVGFFPLEDELKAPCYIKYQSLLWPASTAQDEP